MPERALWGVQEIEERLLGLSEEWGGSEVRSSRGLGAFSKSHKRLWDSHPISNMLSL